MICTSPLSCVQGSILVTWSFGGMIRQKWRRREDDVKYDDAYMLLQRIKKVFLWRNTNVILENGYLLFNFFISPYSVDLKWRSITNKINLSKCKN